MFQPNPEHRSSYIVYDIVLVSFLRKAPVHTLFLRQPSDTEILPVSHNSNMTFY